MSSERPELATERRWEVIIGFAGSSRTTYEIVSAVDRGEAASRATDEYGCTAVAKEVYDLGE